MDHPPDVQKQQEQHRGPQEQQGVVYIQQNTQNYRNQNYSYLNEDQNNLLGSQHFQEQDASFGQLENHYPFISNGHFSPPDSSASIISKSLVSNKSKNASAFSNPQFFPDNDSDLANSQQRSDAAVQFTSANYQSVDLQNLNYQQPSQFFLPSIGSQYQLNDILVPTCQSSGSSESSDEGSVSNVLQQHYISESGGAFNNQIEFPLPISAASQVNRNFQQLQPKDFLDHYMALFHQESQIPRCDSSKSEAAESTCSSLSTGSTESQSENENIFRLPVLVNPVMTNTTNCNVLHTLQSNTQNNIIDYTNQIHHNQSEELINKGIYNNQTDQDLLKFNSTYTNIINATDITDGNVGSVNSTVPSNNQINNLVVMLPNQLSKNLQNFLSTNQSSLPNPSSAEVLNSSKFIVQNQKLNQQKIFGLVNVANQTSQNKMNVPAQINPLIKVNDINDEERCKIRNDQISSNTKENEKSNFSNSSSDENKNATNFNSTSNTAVTHLVSADCIEKETSHIQNTSDSSVINSNFVQNNFSSKSVENGKSSAMLLKETSDKSISQTVSDINNSLVNSNNVYVVKNDESDVKNFCFDDSSTTSCLPTNSATAVSPVPVGWRRLLVDGSIIYLSPSNVALSSIEQVKMYLQTMGTCKCGLECPVNCDSVFNFNPKVTSRTWDWSDSKISQLCNHKRKATVIGSSVLESDINYNKNLKLNCKDGGPTKRKKKRHGNNAGVSVSQLLAQRDRALAAAAARWPTNTRIGFYQNIPTNQYQNVQILRTQIQDQHQVSFENSVQAVDVFKETSPAQITNDKTAQFPCLNINNNSNHGGAILNVNGVNQLLPEGHSTNRELIRPPQILTNQRPEMGQGVLGSTVNYSQCGQECIPNAVLAPRAEGVVLTPQGVLLPPNMIMQRPRSIPPWHRTRLGLNKKSENESPLLYERVPYIQQHMPPPPLVYDDIVSRKKHRANSKIKKSHESTRNQPSFMENPSAYLAQQTALLHNTISRPNFNMNPESRPISVLPQQPTSNSEESSLISISSATQNILLPSPAKNSAFNNNNNNNNNNTSSSSSSSGNNNSNNSVNDHKVDQNNFTPSVVPEKNILEKTNGDSSEINSNVNQSYGEFNFSNHVCSNTNSLECKGSCLPNQNIKRDSVESQTNDKSKMAEEIIGKCQSDIARQQMYNKTNWDWANIENGINQPNLESKSETESVEENPVTSSTEKAPTVFNEKIISDSRPIQGGAISTSNGSPQPQTSPNPSLFRQEESSPKCSGATIQVSVSGNVLISSTTNSSSSTSNSVCSSLVRESDNGLATFKSENLSNKDGVNVWENSFDCQSPNQISASPDRNYKFLHSNCMTVTTSSDQISQQSSDGQEEQTKSQSVSSTYEVQEEKLKQEKNNENKGNRFVRTMASGHTVNSNTITSVQAGKTYTATVTVNNNSSAPPTTISLVSISSQNVTNVPICQKESTKTPLEMVQSVVSSIQTSTAFVKNEIPSGVVPFNKTVLPTTNVLNNVLTSAANINTSILTNNNSNTAPVLKTSPSGLQTGHILLSNNGQYIVASSGNVIPQTNLSGLKLNQSNSMSTSASPVVTNVTGTVTQVLPAVGVAQQVLGQPAVVVNALPTPFVIQPGVMAVDTGLGHLAVATGNVLQSSVIENNALRSSIRGVVSQEKIKNKKGFKKRKSQVASLVQMTSPNNVILNQPFSQQNFAVSPNGNVQPLQALTLVQGKHGGPTQIVMNNQNNFNQFNTQPQQINLLQPVNLASVPNFSAFQHFIVPGLGNMVMTTEGTATIFPDTNLGVQLQLQNVNGQNVITPVQNATSFINSQGILTSPAGMFIRAPNSQQKIIQSNSSPQFLPPNNGQFLVNQFQGQLSPLIAANLSPNQQIFTNSPPRQSPQEFIQIIPTSSSQNTTVVQQNTTIVQQQTTMVSNSQNILNNSGKSNFILNTPNVEKPVELQIMAPSNNQPQQSPVPSIQQQKHQQETKNTSQEKVDIGTQHSVSTQTVVNKETNNVVITTNNTFCQTLNSNWSGSPPDTTTHSPIDSNQEKVRSPRTEETSEDCLSQAMVQYVSSSINENESESESYLLPKISKVLTNYDGLTRSNDKAKNIVESSTLLQESGVQIQIGSGYPPSQRRKPIVDECIVSSHSDVKVQDKHIESQSNISSYEEDKTKLVNSLLTETKSNNLNEEGKVDDLKEKLVKGDLVWGPVKGFPSWPGKLVGPISPGGRALVRWFGGHNSPTRVNVSSLQSLSQGLDAHHRASNKGRKNRRLNVDLEAAIQEAMLELDKMTARQKKISNVSERFRRSHR